MPADAGMSFAMPAHRTIVASSSYAPASCRHVLRATSPQFRFTALGSALGSVRRWDFGACWLKAIYQVCCFC